MTPARDPRLRDQLGRPQPIGAPGEPVSDAPALPPADALAAADRLLRDGRPFTAHEVLEAVWKSPGTADREFWRGLAQLAVAVTHACRSNPTGARSLAERAAANLAPYAAESPYGVDVDGLLRWCRAVEADPTTATMPPPLGGG